MVGGSKSKDTDVWVTGKKKRKKGNIEKRKNKNSTNLLSIF